MNAKGEKIHECMMEQIGVKSKEPVIITDARKQNTKTLASIEFGNYFIRLLNGSLCRKISVTDEMRSVIDSGIVPCEIVKTGSIILIDENVKVEPVYVEVIIVD